jgi:transcriptional regulator with GAF, ATPase, and Fis domain
MRKTRPILDLVAQAQRADPRVPLLIRGERGVGKDILARLIHAASTREPYPFIKVNCAVQAVDRCEADLFGHERGALPLALRRRLGSFECANHGTIYLDEIGALPPGLVAGGRETSRVDVRVIASTSDIAETGGHDDFWSGLRRLRVTSICIPPLRQRTDEIPIFASFFAEQFNRRYRRDVQLCSEAIASLRLRTRSWPGNIRELEETVQRLVAGGSHGSRSLPDPVVAS